jgi:hypothetical protein
MTAYKASLILQSWLDNLSKDRDYFDLLPLDIREYDCYLTHHSSRHQFPHPDLYALTYFFDLIIVDKSNEKYAIKFSRSEKPYFKYPKWVLSECDDYGIEIINVDLNWILQQKEIPKELKTF